MPFAALLGIKIDSGERASRSSGVCAGGEEL